MSLDGSPIPRRSRAGAALFLLALLPFALAVWQWQRGESRSALLSAYEAAATLPAVPLVSLGPHAVPDGRPVALMGRPAGAPLWLDNSLQAGRPGVRLWQPWLLPDGTAVVVDRGWLPAQDATQRLPPLTGPLEGQWVPLPQRFLLDGARRAAEGQIDALDAQALAERLGRPLRPGLVVLTTAVRPLVPSPVRPPFDPARHYGYAVQWLLMGLALTVAAFIFWRRSADEC
ncbi:SURF1 family protein [Gulbenkiania indica]|uniref:SURF1 family protein n=1 Tax=Gulbenkiania indica TaxID=375574 RepID=UPI001FDEEE21|nr:SURF1 family protein [Gulbenkiania indica]